MHSSNPIFPRAAKTEQPTHLGPDVGEGALAGRPHNLAGRQAHRPAGRGPTRQSLLLEHSVLRRLHNRRHPGARSDRAVQRAPGPLQERRLLAA